jgi:ComEC/Rec2-related protein
LKNKYLVPLLLLIFFGFRLFQDLRLAKHFHPNQKVKLNFCLFKEPNIYPTGQYFYYQNHFQTIKIKLAETKKYQLGDCLEIVGKIEKCQNSSRAKYCLLNRSKSIFTRGKNPDFYLSAIVKKFTSLRKSLAQPILENLTYPESDLLTGIVLGRQEKLDKKFFSQLQKSGTLHIIVASGYNLTVVGQKPAEYLSYFIGFQPAVVLGIGLIWVYVGICGFQVPVVRAGVMLTFLLLAKLVGRKGNQLRVLFFTVWLMLMIKPDLLINISFQLSVAALLGLVIGDRIFKWADKNWLTQVIAETLSAQLLVTPILILHFRKISLLAPISNVFIVPLVPILMFLGILALGVGWLPYLAKIILFLVYPLLWWVVGAIKFFAGLPFSEVCLPF